MRVILLIAFALMIRAFNLCAQNPIEKLVLDLVYDEVLSDSLGQDMYSQVTYNITLADSDLLAVHCRMGTTLDGAELFYKIVNLDGSNATSQGVNLTVDGNLITIDFGAYYIPLEFYADVVAIGNDNRIYLPVSIN